MKKTKYRITFGKHIGRYVHNLKSYADRQYCEWALSYIIDLGDTKSEKYKAFKNRVQHIKDIEAKGLALIRSKEIKCIRYGGIIDYYSIYYKRQRENLIVETLDNLWKLPGDSKGKQKLIGNIQAELNKLVKFSF
jgi:hypothetical protein